jgi:hypothetical protein
MTARQAGNGTLVASPWYENILGAVLATNRLTFNDGLADRKGEHLEISVANTIAIGARFHMAVLGNLGTGGARHSVRAVEANEKALVGNCGGQGTARPTNQCAEVEFNGHGLRPLENFRRSVAASRQNATNLGEGLVRSGSVWFGRLGAGGRTGGGTVIPVSGLMGLSRPVFQRSGGGKVAAPRLPLWRAGIAALFPGAAQKKT